MILQPPARCNLNDIDDSIVKRLLMSYRSCLLLVALYGCFLYAAGQTQPPVALQLYTTDVENFWVAFDSAGATADPRVLKALYFDKGTVGLSGFIRGRIQSAENLSATVKRFNAYYRSVRTESSKIRSFAPQIEEAFRNLKAIYPDAKLPPVYFVIGAMNSGGTTSDNEILIAAEMYGLTDQSPADELTKWHKSVLKPVEHIPYIVAHELVHIQQSNNGPTLLDACLKEGSADFIAELISGKHINGHVHEFADPREKELWSEFKQIMHGNKKDGWLYSPSPERPNDLGYWMGYKITKSYYDQATDKTDAVEKILRMRDAAKFLDASGYAAKFDR